MEEVCGPEISIEFVPRRGQWSQAAREEIARCCSDAACLRGLEYRCGRFERENKGGIFRVDKSKYSPSSRDKEIDCICLHPVDVTLWMVVEMFKTLQRCGHTIVATKGLRLSKGDLFIGPDVKDSLTTLVQFWGLTEVIEDDYADVECWCE